MSEKNNLSLFIKYSNFQSIEDKEFDTIRGLVAHLFLRLKTSDHKPTCTDMGLIPDYHIN
jgi:hypothetical protein